MCECDRRGAVQNAACTTLLSGAFKRQRRPCRLLNVCVRVHVKSQVRGVHEHTVDIVTSQPTQRFALLVLRLHSFVRFAVDLL